jgi:hypothetical protein
VDSSGNGVADVELQVGKQVVYTGAIPFQSAGGNAMRQKLGAGCVNSTATLGGQTEGLVLVRSDSKASMTLLDRVSRVKGF